MARSRSRRRSVVRYLARRSHSRRKFTLPLAAVAGLLPVAVGIWNRRSNFTEMGDYVVRGFTGWDRSSNRFDVTNMKDGLMPVAMGFVAHMLASRIGVNRMIAKAGIPIVRI